MYRLHFVGGSHDGEEMDFPDPFPPYFRLLNKFNVFRPMDDPPTIEVYRRASRPYTEFIKTHLYYEFYYEEALL
jgi:hypothetical protein